MPRQYHGLTHTRIYEIYRGIKTRCYNKNHHSYERYGNRGIKMCDEWLKDFLSFYKWSMDNGYTDDLSIDRIDNNKGYSPDNCRWVTIEVQSNNKCSNHIIFDGEEHLTIAQMAKKHNIDKDLLWSRINRGIPVKKAIQNKNLHEKKITFNGVSMTVP